MLHALTLSFKFWQPAITADKTFTQNKEPVDDTAIRLRIAYVFTGTLALALLAIKNYSRVGLVSQNTFNNILPATAQYTLMNRLAVLAVLSLKYSSSLCLAGLVSFFMYKNENSRANRELPALAINQFKTSHDVIDDSLMNYLSVHSVEVEALIKSAPDKIQNLTSQVEKCTLLQSIVNKTDNYHRLLIGRDPFVDQFACFKLIIDHFAVTQQKLSNNDFLLMLMNKKPDFALYALSKGVVNNTPTAQEVVQCWSNVENEQIAEKLAGYGYDINAQHDEKTAVLYVIIKLCRPHVFTDNPAQLCLLFKFGAACNADSLTRACTFKINDKWVTQPIKEWLKDRPTVLAAIKQQAQKPSKD